MYKEKFVKLVNAVGDDEEALDFIKKQIAALHGYVAAVYQMEVELPFLSLHAKGEEYKERYASLDRERSTKHNAAFAAVASLNRLAEQMGVGTIFSGGPYNPEAPGDRLEVAAFCIAVVDEIFHKRVGAPENEA